MAEPSMQIDAATQKELAGFIESELAKRKYQESVQKFTGMCWDKCITSVSSNYVSRTEESCLANCVDRFMDASLYIVSRVESKRNHAPADTAPERPMATLLISDPKLTPDGTSRPEGIQAPM